MQHHLVGLVHGLRVLGQQLELLQVDLLQERVDVDALVQLHDLLVQLRVLLIQHRVVLDQLLVNLRQLVQLVFGLLVGRLQLRELDLQRDQLQTVVSALLSNQVGVLSQRLHVLLKLNLGVQLLASQALLDFEFLVHSVNLFVLELQVQFQLRDLFPLSFELLSLLVSLGHATALKPVLHLDDLLVNFALFAQNLIDLVQLDLLLALEFFDLGLLDADLDFLLAHLRLQCPLLGLVSLEQVGVLESALFLVLLPAQIDDVLVEAGDFVFVLDALLVLLLVDFVPLASEGLHLLDGAVRLSVLSPQLSELSIGFLLFLG